MKNYRQVDHGKRRSRRIRMIVSTTLWVPGFALMISAAVIVRSHPGPWPIEVTFSRAVQSLQISGWLLSFLISLGTLNDPVPAGIALVLWFALMVTFGWFRQASFFVLTVGIGNAIDALIGDYVHRPRPSANLIRVEGIYHNNSFPSGHCAYAVLYYGVLLYLSFSKPVREWRYRWLLIPLQIFAALNIALIGFERIYQGEHWIFDVLGGILDGTLWLCAGIFLYNWIPGVLARRQAKRLEEKSIEGIKA